MIFKKFGNYAIISSGLLMSVFLLTFSAQADMDSAPEMKNIMVAVNDESVLNGLGLQDAEFMFGGNGLPLTYRAQATGKDMARLSSNPEVLYVEEDGVVEVAAVIPNDPYFVTDPGKDSRQWYMEKIKMPQAWEFGKGSRSTKVAIIDTGIHASHVELDDDRVVAGYDVVRNRSIVEFQDSDDNGHGTAVAGVIGAITNNGLGVAGINWKVSLMPVKALDEEGKGRVSDISRAIVWAADNGADVINLSVGGPGFGRDQTLNNAITYAFNKGVVIVAAAGNDLAENGSNLDTSPVYPVCADAGMNMVIGVAATDFNDKKANFSNYGINCIDISAPGKRILTTAYLPSEPSDSVLIYGSGTSLAAPIVSGVAALLKSNSPDLSHNDIKGILLNTTDNIDELNQDTCLGGSCKGLLGRGRINALSALQPQPLSEGSLVREAGTNEVYYIKGSRKHLVSNAVFQLRGFSLSQVLTEKNDQLSDYRTGRPLPPEEGTLMKGPNDPTVYVVEDEVRRPVTYLVFQSRGYSFSSVKIIPEQEMEEIRLGDWFWPPSGTLVLVQGNPTVYVIDEDVKRPVSHFVFTQRELSFDKVMTVTPDEFGHIPNAPDSYWLPPLDNTLIKSDTDPTVYLIENGNRRAVSFEAFVSRNLNFNNINTLTQAEIEIFRSGPALLK